MYTGFMLLGLLEAAERLGVARADILRLHRAPVPGGPERFGDGRGEAIAAALVELTGDPAIGLRVGAEVSVSALGSAALLPAFLPTFREAVTTGARFQRLLLTDERVNVKSDDETFRIVFGMPSDTGAMRRLKAEGFAAFFSRFLQRFVDDAPRDAVAYRFDYPPPPYAPRYESALSGAIHFGQPVISFEVRRDFAERRQVFANPSLASVIALQAERQFLEAAAPGGTAAQVFQLLLRAVPFGRPTEHVLAKELAISARTLRRRLTDEGVTLPQLLQRARAEAARAALGNDSRTIKEIAFDFGFKEVSSFHRAFKKWTGTTPLRVRRGSSR